MFKLQLTLMYGQLYCLLNTLDVSDTLQLKHYNVTSLHWREINERLSDITENIIRIFIF